MNQQPSTTEQAYSLPLWLRVICCIGAWHSVYGTPICESQVSTQLYSVGEGDFCVGDFVCHLTQCGWVERCEFKGSIRLRLTEAGARELALQRGIEDGTA